MVKKRRRPRAPLLVFFSFLDTRKHPKNIETAQVRARKQFATLSRRIHAPPALCHRGGQSFASQIFSGLHLLDTTILHAWFIATKKKSRPRV